MAAVIASPSRLGPYQVIARVHTGEFSTTLRCHDRALGRELAVKTVAAGATDRRWAAARLRKEARVRAGLAHPHALPLHRLIETREGPLLAGPWLDGGSLATRALPLHPAEALAVVEQIGGALDALHAAGWIHGDVSAGNVLFTPDGHAVLADFGSARRAGSRAHAGRGGRAVTLAVSPGVVAPEVWRGERLSGRTDLYSLGVLLYLMLTGGYPFDAADVQALPAMHCEMPVPSPRGRGAPIGPVTEAALLRALAKRPDERFGSGAELAAAVRAAMLEDGVLRRPVDTRDDAPADPAAFGRAAVQAAGERLERFADTLTETERRALSALLEQARTSDARAIAALTGLTASVFGPPACLLALEETGVATVLAERPRTATEVAAACAAPPRAIAQILDVLASLDLVRREGDRFALLPELATIYRSYGRTASGTRPMRDAARLWAHLPHWAATGEPYMEVDSQDGAFYAHVVGVLGTLYQAGAQELAAVLRGRGLTPPGASVLDVGAGSGVWSIAVAAGDARATVTAVDRAQVLEMTRTYARAAGMEERLVSLASDWRDAPLADGSFDLAFLANVCHLEPEWEVREMIRRMYAALRPGGVLAIVDTIPHLFATAEPRELLQGLTLGLRTPGGGVHDRAGYAAWLEAAGFVVDDALVLRATDNRLTAMLARRP